jgi:hypothetical protein
MRLVLKLTPVRKGSTLKLLPDLRAIAEKESKEREDREFEVEALAP